jgi:Flp pilus assembly protein TadG
MNKIRNYWKNKKGITLVWGAFFLVLCLMLAGMAIDIAYMYVAKNQLQVAADAAALAGAANLDGTNSVDQEDAREKAWELACKNTAAGSNVYLVTDNNDQSDNISCNNIPPHTALNIANNNTIDDDIVVGHWDGSSFSSTLQPAQIFNAVQVRARRTAGSPGGPVSVFLGQIFRILGGEGWSLMSARASAIAEMPLMANGLFTMCIDACTFTYPSFDTTVRILNTPSPSGDLANQFIWTTLLQSPATAVGLRKFICANASNENVCTQNIHTNPSVNIFKMVTSIFLDPVTPKTECPPIPGIICPGGGGTGWWVIIPIVHNVACGSGLVDASTPKTVISYALVRVIRVCPVGAPSEGCDDRPPLPAPRPPGCSPGDQTIVIDRLSCISCSDLDDLIGLIPILVK